MPIATINADRVTTSRETTRADTLDTLHRVRAALLPLMSTASAVIRVRLYESGEDSADALLKVYASDTDEQLADIYGQVRAWLHDLDAGHPYPRYPERR